MPDREKVIKGLECCTDGFMMCKRERCPYYGKAPIDSTCRIELEKDALALLKEQEAVEPELVGINTWTCGECGALLGWEAFAQSGLELVKYKFCPECGRKVKWDALGESPER